ncbi:hypothetical protein A3L11_01625 [Thermococcus siculi]|uniref:Uncharacterized protein n=1 Tax=Thermococcus siculi TaxID=72803 RepID=A0A2Z2MMX0_9EURY|nr:hypothetical protein [Thermococcus siculi]ASJ07994.1 hypothetical protein A3L11_01625 [Thermococcus siculi]
MRKAILITLILLLLVPTVSAGELAYYPNRETFQAFLNSSSTYTVVAGSDDWARGWAYYVDEKLYTIKPHGNDTLVLVGNAYNNRLMAVIWNRTGLPKNASLLPSIIVLNNTLLITGSEDNIYLTERAFEDLWNPPRDSLVVFTLLIITIFVLFLVSLGSEGGHAGRFYVLAFSLYALWYLTADVPRLTEGFLAQLLSSLEFAVGGVPSSPLSALMGGVFRVVPPIEENIVFIHWLLVLLVLSFSFYLAPRRARELGFLVFGLAFVAPMFRAGFGHVSGSVLGMAGFVITLAIISNVTFSPEAWKALLQTGVMSMFTLLAVAINPYLTLVPLAFVAAFPKRHVRNYAYLIITGAGAFLLYEAFGMPISLPPEMDPRAAEYLKEFLLNGGLIVVTALYAAFNRKGRITMKGMPAFLILPPIVSLPMAFFVPSLFPYCILLLAAMTVRLIHALTPGT